MGILPPARQTTRVRASLSIGSLGERAAAVARVARLRVRRRPSIMRPLKLGFGGVMDGSKTKPALAGLLFALAVPGVAMAEDRWITVSSGIELHVIDEGEGRPLVFVPGWTLTAEVFIHQIAAFRDDWRVIAIDPRSQGRSTVTVEGNDYVTHAEDLTLVLDLLGAEKPVLVGWSFGCLTTWGYVRQNGPNSVSGHVCIDLSPVTLSADPADWSEGALRDIAGAYHTFLRTDTGQREFMRWYADEVMVQRELEPEELDWIVGQSLQTPHWAAAALFASGMFMDMRETAVALDGAVPTMHVISEHWQDLARPYVERTLPESRIEVMGGHMMFWEYPDKFNAALADFIAGIP
jgi:non-heme chloroperoxidase